MARRNAPAHASRKIPPHSAGRSGPRPPPPRTHPVLEVTDLCDLLLILASPRRQRVLLIHIVGPLHTTTTRTQGQSPVPPHDSFPHHPHQSHVAVARLFPPHVKVQAKGPGSTGSSATQGKAAPEQALCRYRFAACISNERAHGQRPCSARPSSSLLREERGERRRARAWLLCANCTSFLYTAHHERRSGRGGGREGDGKGKTAPISRLQPAPP